MRESDDEAVRRASIYVDTRAGALKEAGDIVQPLRRPGSAAKTISSATSSTSAAAKSAARRADDEITLFKSVGTALEDLAAATARLRQMPATRAEPALPRWRRPQPRPPLQAMLRA